MAPKDGTKTSEESHSPAHYRIPNEEGYFPAGSDEVDALVEIENVTIHQLRGDDDDDDDESEDRPPLASGTLTLRDPAAGTADDVALVGRCDDTLCYVLVDDATVKMSETRFGLVMPPDDVCIVVDLGEGVAEADALRVEGLLAARTRFRDETKRSAKAYPEALPDDLVSRAMFRASTQISQLSVSVGEMGASRIDAYGERKKEGVTETKEVKVGRASIMVAKGTRAVSKKTHEVTTAVSDRISDAVGGKVGKATAANQKDSAVRKRGKNLLLASALSYAEISDGASEGYEAVARSAQDQATSFVAKKYGKDAAELARHTAGAAANFGRAALTAKRVVSAKKLVKTAAKNRVKEEVKSRIF